MIKPVELSEFYVVGLAERTSNEREMTGEGVIGALWNRLYGERVLDAVPNRTDFNIYAVYSDYESDDTGEYTFLLGAKVNSPTPVPDGMMLKRVPGGRYAVVTSDRAPVVEAVVGTWRKIWGMSATDLGGERAYQTDFELYDERACDPQNSQVDIYLGLS
jgi:predicted transcriptional regulator YdeE